MRDQVDEFVAESEAEFRDGDGAGDGFDDSSWLKGISVDDSARGVGDAR